MDGDLIALHTGQVLVTHGADQCQPPCTIRFPSDHHMVGWPQVWRGDRGVVERRCPHGIGHPYPGRVRNSWMRRLLLQPVDREKIGP